MQKVLGEELIDGWGGQVESEDFEDQVLHSENLLLGVGVVCNVHKLCYFWGVNFFKLPAMKKVLSHQS